MTNFSCSIDGNAPRSSRQPCPSVIDLYELAAVTHCPQECLLHGIFGILTISQDGICNLEDESGVLVDGSCQQILQAARTFGSARVIGLPTARRGHQFAQGHLPGHILSSPAKTDECGEVF